MPVSANNCADLTESVWNCRLPRLSKVAFRLTVASFSGVGKVRAQKLIKRHEAIAQREAKARAALQG